MLPRNPRKDLPFFNEAERDIEEFERKQSQINKGRRRLRDT